MTVRAAAAIGLALCAGPAMADDWIAPKDAGTVTHEMFDCPAANLRTYAYCVASETWPVDIGKSPSVDGINVRSGSKVYIGGNPAAAVSDLCFSPEGPSCEAMMIRQIDAAQKQVRVSVYEWTLKSLGAALMRARDRGVDIAVVVDKAAVRSPDAPAQAFAPHVNHAAGGLNHDKFIVIDGEVLCTGSFNWSWSAEHKNAENAICLRSADVAARYLQHWGASAK